jgi:hypothetical protein
MYISKSPQEGMLDDDVRPVSPKSVIAGALASLLKGKSFSESPATNEPFDLEPSKTQQEQPRDIALQGRGGGGGEIGSVAGSRPATWKNKDKVQKKIKAEIRNCSTRIQGSWSDYESQTESPPTVASKNQTTAETATMSFGATEIRKQVRFKEWSNGEIKAETTVQSLCTVQLSKVEIKNLWWSKQERSQMKRRAHAVASHFLATTPEYRLAAELLLLVCCDAGDNKMEWEIDQAKQEDKTDLLNYEEALRIVVNSEARGLEQPLVSAMNLESCRFYHKCGRTSINSVLEAQVMWKNIPCFSAEQLASMIAMQLRQYSGFAAHFARILAEGDAKVANGAYDSDGEGENQDESTSSLSFDGDDNLLLIPEGQNDDAGLDQFLI